MSSRPRLLDLFCGAGGAAVGYMRAGFEVVGVDHKPQPNYPFEHHQMDSLGFNTSHFDAIHASPPCQSFSRTRKIMEGKGISNPRAVDLVAFTREKLIRSGLPYVIENVPGAPLIHPVLLCGTMFPELRVYRHRIFEFGPLAGIWRESITPPDHPRHTETTGSHRGYSYGYDRVTITGHNYNVADGKKAMGIDWMKRDELNEAIPPAYTEWIGSILMGFLQ